MREKRPVTMVITTKEYFAIACIFYPVSMVSKSVIMMNNAQRVTYHVLLFSPSEHQSQDKALASSQPQGPAAVGSKQNDVSRGTSHCNTSRLRIEV